MIKQTGIIEDWIAAAEERAVSRTESRARVENTRELLFRLASRRFGEPDAQTRATIETQQDIEILDQLFDRVAEVNSWPELLEGN